jgi:hypothetical protein
MKEPQVGGRWRPRPWPLEQGERGFESHLSAAAGRRPLPTRQVLADDGLHPCGPAEAARSDWTGHGDLCQPLARIVSYSQWRVIAATAATSPANAMSSPVSAMSSPLTSVARQRKRATVRIRARMRDFGSVMPSTMVHHYNATVE